LGSRGRGTARRIDVMRSPSLALLAAAFTAAACGSSESSPGQAGGPETGTAFDAGIDGSSTADTRTGDDGSAGPDGLAPADGSGAEAAAPVGLSSKYPCDKGLTNDPAVLWLEDFEEGSVAAVTARYDSANHPPGMTLVPDVPPQSCGKASMKLTSGTAANATDLYKRLVPAHDEWFVRWYAKYQAGIQWHHTGVWIGGYDPPIPYPNPQAGLQPTGSDRFSVAVEPVFGSGQPNPRFDFYNYWMKMHSWMDQPQGPTAYYGNSLVHRNSFTADDDTWACLEVHVKLNSDLASSAGAELDVWKNDVLVQHFDQAAPVGCWIKDKFCASGADGSECTAYPNLCAQPYVPLDLQWRSTASLQLDAFWPQNYITQGPDGSVEFDSMVVATTRVGCTTP
jgi:hypothetical protein